MADDMTSKPGGKQPPPKIRISAENGKAAPSANAPSGPPTGPRPTIRIGKPSDPKKSTSRIDLSAASAPVNLDELSKTATIPIAVPAQSEEFGKKSTIRIDQPGSAAPGVVDKETVLKKATVRIEIPSDIQPAGVADAIEAAKKTTARVIIDEDRAKGDTARIEPAVPEPPDATKKRTTRIDLGEVPEEEQDIFKRRTTVMDATKLAGAAGEVPRTIRIKRPEGAAPTTEIPPITAPPPQQVESARKSETARINLPPEVAAVEEQPPTRKKTIKIKRPGAATSAPLVITRAPAEGLPAGEVVPAGEPQPHPAFAWIALVAVIVAVVLVYVLAAQVGTAPDLLPARFPYPGRL